MKQASEYKKVLQQLLIAGTFILVMLAPGSLFAQADSIIKTDITIKTDSINTEETAATEESSLISPSIDFISVQKGDNSIDLAATLKAKIKGTFIKLKLLKITFLQVIDEEERALGFVISDNYGKAVLNIKADSLKLDKEGKLHFKAVYAGNKQVEPAEEEVIIKRARLEITPAKEDSLLTVKIKLVDVGTGTEIPVKETALGIFIHRSFFPLKVGEGTTDENGEATVEIPHNLPGDAKGYVTILARLDENEIYGNLETSVVQKWGVPVSDQFGKQPRELWSTDPPYWMMITFIILMTTVWGHYLVIIIQLFRLRKEEPEIDSPNIEHIS